MVGIGSVNAGFTVANLGKGFVVDPINKRINIKINVIGEIRLAIQGVLSEGWVKLDGREISTLPDLQRANATSIGLTTKLPDATGVNLTLAVDGDAIGAFIYLGYEVSCTCGGC